MAYKSLSEAISAKRAELEEAKIRVGHLTTQLEAFLEAERLVGGPYQASSESRSRAEANRPTATTKRRAAKRTKSERPKRGPKGIWKSIMGELEKNNGNFRLSDVEAVCVNLNLPIKPNAVRSQMANYVNAKFVTRVSNGLFKFTEIGKETFSSTQKNDDFDKSAQIPEEVKEAAE